MLKKVTGLSVKDFELLVSLGVFNDALMNDVVYKFRRYKDASLSYAGIERHAYDAKVGLFDTSLSQADYEDLKQRDSLLSFDGHLRNREDGAIIENEMIDDRNENQKADVISTRKPLPKRAVDVIEIPGFAATVRANAEDMIENDKVKGASVSDGNQKADNCVDKSREVANDKPIVTQEQLDALTPGDTVFHKAFGRGNIIYLDDDYIEVTFANDDKKKKPSRKFMFPSSFYQELCGLSRSDDNKWTKRL